MVVVVLIVAMLYYATPNVRQPKFRWISVGAAVAIVIWIVASVGFAFYVANFASYNKTYGSLAGVVVSLVFLWLTNVALLLGAEIDSELERGRQLQAGVAAERELQLPARDTRNIEKAAKQEQKDAAAGRRIRRAGAEEVRRPRHGKTKESTMRKLMLLVAVAAGYVLGARAGRQRYEQIKQTRQGQGRPAGAVGRAPRRPRPLGSRRRSSRTRSRPPHRSAADKVRSPRLIGRRRAARSSSTPTAPPGRTTPTRRATCRDGSTPIRLRVEVLLAAVDQTNRRATPARWRR